MVLLRRFSIIWMGVSLAGYACSDPRPQLRQQNCIDYESDLQPALNAACGDCHSASTANGGYSVDSWRTIITAGKSGDAPAVAGDTQSPMLRKAAGEAGHPAADAPTQELLQRWIVTCGLSFFGNTAVHPKGWLNPASPEFHAHRLYDSGWKFETCAECHGGIDGDNDNSGGGASGHACTSCHTGGATACATCHGSDWTKVPPRGLSTNVALSSRNAVPHRLHLDGGPILAMPVACDSCHVVPTKWDEPGHLLLTDGSVDRAPAEVTFGAPANASIAGIEDKRLAPASWHAASLTCTNVACHGGAWDNAEGWTPSWLEQANVTDDCETCHGLPPSGAAHDAALAITDCVVCHASMIDADGAIIEPAQHLDNRISLGDNSEQCGACHGSAEGPMPGRGVHGETSVDDLAIGAHATHISGSLFADPLPCEACHRMPSGADFYTAVSSPGHLVPFGRAEVFRDADGALLTGLATEKSGTVALAAADQAAALYDYDSGTCEVYCHGAGERLATDRAPSVRGAPQWNNVGNNAVFCGSCHGIPPESGVPLDESPWHLNTAAASDCGLCHWQSISSTGGFSRDSEGQLLHLNGAVE